MSPAPGRPARPNGADRRRIALRSTLLQAGWNYETLQAIGFAWAILPGLARIYPDPAARARRLLAYLDLFNSNPYLATLGLGVALRVEGEVARGAPGAERRVERLLAALRGSLGALGDGLFWGAWRAALGLAAAVLALATASPWPAVAYLVLYNVLAQGVRAAGVRAGYASGAGIARVLQDPFWARATATARTIGALAAGAAVGAGIAWAAGAGLDPGAARGGGWVGLGIFSLAIGLLWVAGVRAGQGGRSLPPAAALLAVVILLSAWFHLSEGARP